MKENSHDYTSGPGQDISAAHDRFNACASSFDARPQGVCRSEPLPPWPSKLYDDVPAQCSSVML
jgi:hypothetical protein